MKKWFPVHCTLHAATHVPQYKPKKFCCALPQFPFCADKLLSFYFLFCFVAKKGRVRVSEKGSFCSFESCLLKGSFGPLRLKKEGGIFNTGSGSRASSHFFSLFFVLNGNVGAGYGFYTFAK